MRIPSNPHMRHLSSWVAALVFLVAGIPAGAAVQGSNRLSIDLTKLEEAQSKADWFPKLKVTPEGLGFDGPASETVDGWLQTKPMGVGLSWRPPTSVRLNVVIKPEAKSIKLDNGQTFTPFAGRVFARYSADFEHWSSWQALKQDSSASTNSSERIFSGDLTVPQRDRQSYSAHLSDYSRLDVPWGSDEEAAVKWIVQTDPKFFEHNLPFIGYVEFMFEAPFQGSRRITSFDATIDYVVGGFHQIPKDKTVKEQERDTIPWRYKAP